MTNDFNVHVTCDEREYRRIVAHARQLGVEPKVQAAADGTTLYCTLPVTLYVTPGERKYKVVNIHDRTYSKNVFRCEEVYSES